MNQNPELRERVSREFVPVVLDLLTMSGADADWFLAAAKRINPNLRPGMQEPTHQGYYMLGADGGGYGYWHNRHMGEYQVKNAPGELQPRVDLLYPILEHSLELFRAKPSKQIKIEEGTAPSGPLPKPDTTVIRVYARLINNERGHPIYDGIGRDTMWIYADEVKKLLTSGTAGKPEIPKSLIYRIVRYHLLDTVRGLAIIWRPDDIRQADFSVREVGEKGEIRKFIFSGRFAMQAPRRINEHTIPDNPCAYTGTIEGRLEVESTSNKVTAFRAYAEGLAQGDAIGNGGVTWKKELPLVIGMTEIEGAEAKLFPPRKAKDINYRYPAGVPKVKPVGPDLLKPVLDLASWDVGISGGGVGKLSLEGETLRYDISSVGKEEWRVQFSQGGFTLEEGTQYLLRFRMKADVARPAYVRANVSAEDRHTIGLEKPLNLTTAWQDFTFTFTANRIVAGMVVVPRFILGQQTGTVWVADVSLTKME